MPLHTHFLGPAVIPGEGSANTRLLAQIAITRDLIKKLPRDMASISQKMHRGVGDVIAFQMEGFRSTSQFTFELEPAPPDQLWRQMRDKTRNAARKAGKTYTVDDTVCADEFIKLYCDNLRVRRRREIFDLEVLKQLIIECRGRGRGRALAARDRDGVAKAAIFCIWDKSVCYYLHSTRASDSGNGAVTLLLWSAIQRAAAGGLVFDFDGLGDAGSVLFFAGFGAVVKPRYVVTRSSATFRLLREATGLLLNKPESVFFT